MLMAIMGIVASVRQHYCTLIAYHTMSLVSVLLAIVPALNGTERWQTKQTLYLST